MCTSARSWPEADEAARRGAAARQDAVWCHLPVVPLQTRRCLLGLIPVSVVAVLTQAERVAEFAAKAAALGGITWVTLVVSGFLTLAACVFSLPVTLVVCGFLTLVACVFVRRGCRRPGGRRRQELRPFGPCLRRFRGRSWPGVRRTRLFCHIHHATVTVHAGGSLCGLRAGCPSPLIQPSSPAARDPRAAAAPAVVAWSPGNEQSLLWLASPSGPGG